MKLTLEKRPTSLATISKLIATGMVVAVVYLMFVAPLVVRRDYGSLSPGERVNTTFDGFGYIDRVEGETVFVRQEIGGKIVAVPRDLITEF